MAESYEVRNPADGSLVGTIPYGDAATAIEAADAARAAFPSWSTTPARARADILLRISAMLAERADTIGRLLSTETGKRLPEGVAELRFSSEYFRWFAEEARRTGGEIIPNEAPNRRHHVISRPAGVALSLTPWNFPVSIQARKLAPALAAGCTVVARTSEKAPLAVVELFKVMEEAGLPKGVATLVHGPAPEQTEALLEHPAVRVVSFTGSTQVGRLVMKQASQRIVRPLLELGGDAPYIVFADADMDRAIEGAMAAKFRNNGQSCIAANRFFVEGRVFDEFTERLASRMDAMKIGDPLGAEAPDLGPLIDAERRDAVAEVVNDALARGGELATGTRDGLDGAFMAPALVVGAPDDSRIGSEEIFGPAAGVFRFGDEDEVVERANNTEMGLAAYVYTSNLERSIRMQDRIQSGILGLNNALPSVAFSPMGGVKQSGIGREGARQGLEEFSALTYVSTELGEM